MFYWSSWSGRLGEGLALQAHPGTCVGTDSHTTIVNGLDVLDWGGGGIEAEAAMLGQPVSMLILKLVGFAAVTVTTLCSSTATASPRCRWPPKRRLPI